MGIFGSKMHLSIKKMCDLNTDPTAMSDIHLTRNGIAKLTLIQGKFCKSNVIIQVILEDYPMDSDGPRPIEEYNAVIADATHCFPAIVNDFTKLSNPGINVIRVTEALCCFSPDGYFFFVDRHLPLTHENPVKVFSS